MPLYQKKIKSPVGELTLLASETALVGVFWPGQRIPKRFAETITPGSHPLLERTLEQLKEHFAGKRHTFDLPIEFRGTEFQKRVWTALRDIPYGRKQTYRDIATRVGNSKAVRATGAAIGKNPISIVVPCHRVVGSNGKLTGFAGGLPTKKFLLALEA